MQYLNVYLASCRLQPSHAVRVTAVCIFLFDIPPAAQARRAGTCVREDALKVLCSY